MRLQWNSGVTCKVYDFIHNNLVEKDIKRLDCLLKEYVGSTCDPFLTLLSYRMGTVKCDLSSVTFVQIEMENNKWLYNKITNQTTNVWVSRELQVEATKANQTKSWYFLGSWSLALIHKNEVRSTCNGKEGLWTAGVSWDVAMALSEAVISDSPMFKRSSFCWFLKEKKTGDVN